MSDIIVYILLTAATVYSLYHIGKTLIHGEEHSSHCDECSVKQIITTQYRNRHSVSEKPESQKSRR